jgi:hypothetical protein
MVQQHVKNYWHILKVIPCCGRFYIPYLDTDILMTGMYQACARRISNRLMLLNVSRTTMSILMGINGASARISTGPGTTLIRP